MSTRLTLGAVGALAGLAALSRRRPGSRGLGAAVALAPRVSAEVELCSIEDFIGIAQGGSDETIAMVYAIGPQGSKRLVQRVSVESIWDELNAEIDVMQEGGRLSEDEAVVAGARTVYRWLQGAARDMSLVFPLTVYRGIRLPEGHQASVGDPGMHWTTWSDIAMSFAAGEHVAASSGDHGVVLRGTISRPRDIDWASVLYLYLTYSAKGGPEVEMQVRPRGDVEGVEVWETISW